jgi:D-threonate/D-erythronate kinase
MMQASMAGEQVRSGEDRAARSRVVILADDLTGACDSGVAFLSAGYSVRVVLGPPPSSAEGQADVTAFTTETRNASADEARERVAEYSAAAICGEVASIVFKKIDSAARGHLGAETMAALEACGATLAMVTPAFPETERTVHSGILSVRDCSGQDARISLRDQFPQVDSTEIDFLHAGFGVNLLVGIDRAIANRTRILICDAETQEDLDRLAEAGIQMQQSLLWAGSAGLARALAKVLPGPVDEIEKPAALRAGRVLLFAGTTHPVTVLQIAHLREHLAGAEDAIFDVEFGETSREEIRAAVSAGPVGSLILTGGDTAWLVLRSLEASSLVLAGELAPGIPWGFVEGGAADGCVVVTKSGGFGDRDALVRAFEFCNRRAHEAA